ncbi:PIG-L family deacetylase [Trinickia terrae]|uniref:PIG-L family deacetylase n=1 Tax=Trinickia terrae TaxID=2571161 RepID=A0A4U1I249_9BURK|nr:PIG-L family deacetylase [Trinickia terrae]TKC87279.1 PIG-L family deacetylase [Trinickia terrae]
MSTRAPVLYLSPHRDDIAYSLAGRVLSARGPRGAGIAVTVFTRSDFAPYARAGLTADEITQLRALEEARACRALNLETMALPFAEAPLRGYGSDALFVDEAAALRDPIVDTLAERFAALHAQLKPCAVYAPLGIGGHVDHLVTRAAAQIAFGPHCPLPLYEDLPYAGELDEAGYRSALQCCTGERRGELTAAGGWLADKLGVLSFYASQVARKDLDAVISHTNRIGGERVWIAG